MATTSSRSIEITVISGEDLRIDRKSVKRKTFVTVKFDRQSIGGGGGGRTEIDERGGCYPFWNEKMLMEIPVDAMFLTIEVHCGSISRNRIVGTANVPVSDFLGRCSAGQTEFFTRLGRLLKEKAKSDVEKVFFGFSKTRDNLAVIYEFLLYWNLPEIDRVLDELEEALFVSDFGQRIAPLRSWRACVTTSAAFLAGKGNETDLQLGFRCAFFIA
ncbi:uncharacterized protein LOC111479767 isoform X6 [Cucurbita maxima]|uniref:Uncharacterized protein LOC111479767 isoform X6 n=1 Tax=Cucurbita maxima TaxID=3661 RepID=A0A6J1ITG6_CUCMA|nr:uncharacterized protein LOC111479767 isoform X6 [Cucurbita maxima]